MYTQNYGSILNPSPDWNGILLDLSGFKNLTGLKDRMESRKQLLIKNPLITERVSFYDQ